MTRRLAYRILTVSLALGVTLGVLSPIAALADQDSDRAFDAVKKGEIAPLSSILAQVREMYGGRVLEVELEEEPLNKPEDNLPEIDDEENIANQELDDEGPGETGNPIERFLPVDGQPLPSTAPGALEAPKTDLAAPRFQPLPRFVDDPNAPVMYYEIKLLTDDGYVLKLKFDARSSDLLSVDGHNKTRKKHGDEEDEPGFFDRFLNWGD